MKIRTLLLGSAAALLAVTGAQAADPVAPAPEAEPVEYVRICDAYGAGFFYIPGTETCLRISGYVRIDWQTRSHHDQYTRTKARAVISAAGVHSTVYDAVPDTAEHRWQYRGRLNFDARNETEWGTLRSQLRYQGSGGQGYSVDDAFSDTSVTFRGSMDANVSVDRALISLAGFNLGYSDDYWTTVGGYGYFQARNDGYYAYAQALFFDYTYAADGFTLTAGVQSNDGVTTAGSGIPGQPDFYVGATYSGSWGRAFGTYYYDASGGGSVATGPDSSGGGAWKVGLQLALSDYIPGANIKGWYMSDDGDTDYVKGHVWGLTYEMDLVDNWRFYTGYSDYDWSNSTEVWSQANDDSRTQFVAGLSWNVASGLLVQFEFTKENWDYQIDGVVTTATVAGNGSRLSTSTYGIRVVRSF